MPRQARIWTAFLAAAMALTPLAGTAQSVTTVTPLVSRPDIDPLGPIPDLAPQVLTKAADKAHDAAAGDLGYACRLDYSEDEPGISAGGLANAFLATDFRAQAQLEIAARNAQEATAKAHAAQGSSEFAVLEAARVAATRGYLSAKMVADEAAQRFTDLQDYVSPGIGARGAYLRRLATLYRLPMNDPPKGEELRAVIDEMTRQRLVPDGVQGVYIPGEFADLGLTDVKVGFSGRPGGPRDMHFAGRIRNPRRMAIMTPPMWFTATDAAGIPVKSEQAKPERARPIPAGGRQTFTYSLRRVPAEAVGAVVTFAPTERARIPARIAFTPSGGGCPPKGAEREALRAGTVAPPDAAWIGGSSGPRKTHPWALNVADLPWRQGNPGSGD